MTPKRTSKSSKSWTMSSFDKILENFFQISAFWSFNLAPWRVFEAEIWIFKFFFMDDFTLFWMFTIVFSVFFSVLWPCWYIFFSIVRKLRVGDLIGHQHAIFMLFTLSVLFYHHITVNLFFFDLSWQIFAVVCNCSPSLTAESFNKTER